MHQARHSLGILPRVEIVEQPMSRGQRFRYKCEGKSAGSLQGQSSTQTQKTYPAIKIHNHNGPAAVVVSCVTKDPPYYPHPHNLVGQDCKNGVATLKVKHCSSNIVLANVGVQCCKKQDIMQHLNEREKIKVDPFGNYKEIRKENMDLGVVRLCFQVFLPNDEKKYKIPLEPVVSDPIIDKKCVQELVICKTSIQAGSCRGGNEMFLLCEKISKDDIQVRFYEESIDGISWQEYGQFQPSDVHRQCAIVLKTPPYKDPGIKKTVSVFVQLCKPSDNTAGEPISFQYYPNSIEMKVHSTQDELVIDDAIINQYLQSSSEFTVTSSEQQITTTQYSPDALVDSLIDVTDVIQQGEIIPSTDIFISNGKLCLTVNGQTYEYTSSALCNMESDNLDSQDIIVDTVCGDGNVTTSADDGNEKGVHFNDAHALISSVDGRILKRKLGDPCGENGNINLSKRTKISLDLQLKPTFSGNVCDFEDDCNDILLFPE